jgi:multidrug resistance efflux pump
MPIILLAASRIIMSDPSETRIAELEAMVVQKNAAITDMKDQLSEQTARAEAAEEELRSYRTDDAERFQDDFGPCSRSQIDQLNMADVEQDLAHEKGKSIELNAKVQKLEKEKGELETRVGELEEVEERNIELEKRIVELEKKEG